MRGRVGFAARPGIWHLLTPHQLEPGGYGLEAVRPEGFFALHGSGKVRELGIPAVADRAVRAILKLVLEPISEAVFKPVPYDFRPL